MRFTLTIELGNDAMQRFGDIAKALQFVARRFSEYPVTSAMCEDTGFALIDANGNTIGSWRIAKEAK